jgi:hypothetical protein
MSRLVLEKDSPTEWRVATGKALILSNSYKTLCGFAGLSDKRKTTRLREEPACK